MTDKLTLLANEGNIANKGILISAIIIFAGLFPEIEVSYVKIIPVDSWSLILGGVAMLFYFVSIKINQTEHVDDKGRVWVSTPMYKSEFSKECFSIAIITLLIFCARGFYLLIKLVLQSG